MCSFRNSNEQRKPQKQQAVFTRTLVFSHRTLVFRFTHRLVDLALSSTLVFGQEPLVRSEYRRDDLVFKISHKSDGTKTKGSSDFIINL